MGSLYMWWVQQTLNHWPLQLHLHRLRTYFHLQAPEIIFQLCVAAFVGVDTGDHLHPLFHCCLFNKHINCSSCWALIAIIWKVTTFLKFHCLLIAEYFPYGLFTINTMVEYFWVENRYYYEMRQEEFETLFKRLFVFIAESTFQPKDWF